jgi:LPXTG-motif cell wall-anchored protein
MRKGWMRATLAFGLAGATVLLSGAAASAASTVTARNDAGSTTAGVAVQLRVTDNDDVATGAKTQTIDAPATTPNGKLSASGSVLTYTPNAGFTGTDGFTYELCATFDNPDSYATGDQKVCDEAEVHVVVGAASAAGAGGVSAYGGGVSPYAAGDVQGTGTGGSLPTTGAGANLLLLLGIALVIGGVACYGATRDGTRALVR